MMSELSNREYRKDRIITMMLTNEGSRATYTWDVIIPDSACKTMNEQKLRMLFAMECKKAVDKLLSDKDRLNTLVAEPVDWRSRN